MKKEYISPDLQVLRADMEMALLQGSAVKNAATVEALAEDSEYSW